MRRFLLYGLPPVLIAATIFFLSSRSQIGGPEIPHLDKVAHATAFGALAFFTMRAFLAYGHPLTRALSLGVVLAVLYGVSDEVHQMSVPGRSPDVLDLVADTAGALLAALVWRRLRGPGK